MRAARRASPLLCLALVLTACGSGGSGASPVPGISILPDNPNQPYGIVAIEYHFHDAHPSFPLDPTRTVIWTNEGTVTHNVTFPQFGFSKDFSPGRTITIKDLGQKLGGAGTYQFFCRFHESLGMIGTVIIK